MLLLIFFLFINTTNAIEAIHFHKAETDAEKTLDNILLIERHEWITNNRKIHDFLLKNKNFTELEQNTQKYLTRYFNYYFTTDFIAKINKIGDEMRIDCDKDVNSKKCQEDWGRLVYNEFDVIYFYPDYCVNLVYKTTYQSDLRVLINVRCLSAECWEKNHATCSVERLDRKINENNVIYEEEYELIKDDDFWKLNNNKLLPTS